MAVFETVLRSDLKSPLQVVQLGGNLFSADNEGNKISVEVFDNGSPATLSGNVTGYVIRADNATVIVSGTLANNKASVVLPTSAYTVVGHVSIVIKVGTTTVGACTAYVYRTTTDTIVDPDHVIPSIAELLEKIADCEAATAAATAAATNANTKAALADEKATLANAKAALADEKATAANTAAGTANAAATKIDDMTVAANGLAAGASPTVAISEVSGHKHILFGIPKGDPGDATIDDTAGIGDTDKVWSADKDAKEISALKSAKAPIILEAISTPADVQTFSDGADGMPVKTLTVGIEPVQDLHGQDSPYPAGGGKNLIPYPYKSGGSQTINDVAFTISDNGKVHVQGTATAMVYFNLFGSGSTAIPSWVKPNTTYYLQPAIASGKYFVQFILYGSTNYAKAGGNSFTTPADLSEYTACAIVIGVYNGATMNDDIYPMLEEGASASAWQPYSNICPITGHTGANVYRTGKNLMSLSDVKKGRYNDNTFVLSSTTSDVLRSYEANLPAGTYTISFDKSVRIICTIADGEYTAVGADRTSRTITTSGGKIGISWRDATSSSTAWDDTSPIQLEVGSSASSYEAFAGNTYTYPFPSQAGTVYGGTLTIHQDGTGELVVDREKVDLGDLTWTYTTDDSYAGSPYFSSGNVADKKAGSSNMICSQYAVGVNRGSIQDCVIAPWNGTNALSLACRDDRFTDAETFKTAMSGVQLVYELATPVVYTLTVPQVLSLLGTNNLWADTGKINAVEYPADTKLYIDKKLTELQALVLEN